MRAAVVRSIHRSPELGDFQNPQDEGDVGRVLAAGLNPVDLAIVAGKLPFRTLEPPAVAGFDGVAERRDGTHVYFSALQAPFGSFAELVPLAGAETTPVPVGLDPVLAAALGVPGTAAWLALTQAGSMQAGMSVLVLGASGSVGRIAVQAARALGASTVVGTARSADGLAGIEELGAKAVASSDPADFDRDLTRVTPDGFDIVVDTLWGAPLVAALPHLRTNGRVAQVGNSAAMQAEVVAPAFRNRRVSIVGHSNFLASAQDRREAFTKVAELTARGEIRFEPTPVPLGEFEGTWQELSGQKLASTSVIVP